MTDSGDRSSSARKRALRRLAREDRATYRELYAEARPRTQTHDQARGRAFTLLRYRYPDRYLELYALERVGPGTDIPPAIRSKAWQKANRRLADLRTAAYREVFAQMRARGLNRPCAYDMAITQLRNDNAELFARLLTEEITLSLSETRTPDITTACELCGAKSSRFDRHSCAQPCGQTHHRCKGCGTALDDCYWKTARSTIDLLVAHAATIAAAFRDAIQHRRPPDCSLACDGGRPPCPGHDTDREQVDPYWLLAHEIHRQTGALAAHSPADRPAHLVLQP